METVAGADPLARSVWNVGLGILETKIRNKNAVIAKITTRRFQDPYKKIPSTQPTYGLRYILKISRAR